MVAYKIHNGMDRALCLDLLAIWEQVDLSASVVSIAPGAVLDVRGFHPEVNTLQARFDQAVTAAGGTPGTTGAEGTIWLE
jgi:hypothetical protein